MDLAMRQGYGACALPLCGGGRLLRRRSETARFSLFFSIFIFFIVFSCVLFVFSFMASPRSARTDALFTVREPPVLRLDARRALAADENFAASRSVTLDARVPSCSRTPINQFDHPRTDTSVATHRGAYELGAGWDCVWSAARVRVLVPKGSFHLREAT